MSEQEEMGGGTSEEAQVRQAMADLIQEHRLIGRVLGSLGTFVSRLDPEDPEARRRLGDYAEFFRRYVEDRHERMEEAVFFHELGELGGSSGAMALLIEESRQRLARIETLEAAASGRGPLTEAELEGVLDAVATYAGQMRSHMLKEDRSLFPLVETLLTQANLGEMLESLSGIARSDDTRLVDLAERLVEQSPPIS